MGPRPIEHFSEEPTVALMVALILSARSEATFTSCWYPVRRQAISSIEQTESTGTQDSTASTILLWYRT